MTKRSDHFRSHTILIPVVTFDHENSVNNYETKVTLTILIATFYPPVSFLLLLLGLPLFLSPSFLPLSPSFPHLLFRLFFPAKHFYRRRTGTGGLPLKTIIPDVEIREKLVTGHFSPIILYEDGGSDSGSLTSAPDSIALYVAKSIQEELGIRTIHLLEGKRITHS